MGAAIPIIGAVAGAAGTVANISAQQKQAQAQRDAIDSQQKAIESNTNLRLLDLERQKLYSQYLAQIDEARRAQLKQQDDAELQVARMKDEMQLGMAAKQNEEAYTLGNQRNEGMNRLAGLQNQTSEAVGNAQLNNQYQIGSLMGAADAQALQNQMNMEYQGQTGNINIGRENAFLQSLGIDSQAAQARFGKQTEAFGVESQATSQGTQALMQVAQAFMNQKAQGKQNAKGRATAQAMLAGLGGGNDSRSMQALMEENLGQDLDSFIQTVMQGGRAAESAMAQVGLAGNQADLLRQLGSIMGDSLTSQAEGTRGIADATAGLQRTENDARYQTATGDLAYKQKLNNLNLRDQYVLNQLALKDQVALSNMGNEEQYTLNKLALQSAMADNRLNINDSRQLNKIGYDAYTSARDMQFGIEQAQSELNRQFYDTNLSSAATTIKSSASSELQNLRAARSSISSPGILSYASAGIGAFNSISGAIGNMQQVQQQPYQPQQFGTSNMNYVPGALTNGSKSFTNAGSYGILSGYKLGGIY